MVHNERYGPIHLCIHGSPARAAAGIAAGAAASAAHVHIGGREAPAPPITTSHVHTVAAEAATNFHVQMHERPCWNAKKLPNTKLK